MKTKIKLMKKLEKWIWYLTSTSLGLENFSWATSGTPLFSYEMVSRQSR